MVATPRRSVSTDNQVAVAFRRKRSPGDRKEREIAFPIPPSSSSPPPPQHPPRSAFASFRFASLVTTRASSSGARPRARSLRPSSSACSRYDSLILSVKTHAPSRTARHEVKGAARPRPEVNHSARPSSRGLRQLRISQATLALGPVSRNPRCRINFRDTAA